MSDRLSTVPSEASVIATNEKITGPPGKEMLRLSGLTSASEWGSLEIMDNACGGGTLTFEVLALAKLNATSINVKRIVATDNDATMLAYIGQRSKDSDWHGVEIKQIDQSSVPLSDGSFTHVFNDFGIFFCVEDNPVLLETYRILKFGGVAGFTSWKSIAWVPSVAAPAIKTFIPDAPPLPSPTNIFPAQDWDSPSMIRTKLEKAGFRDVHVNEYSFTPNVAAEEFAEATAVLVRVMTSRLWNKEDHAKFEGQIEPALLRYLEQTFPGGMWDGKMTAIISVGKK